MCFGEIFLIAFVGLKRKLEDKLRQNCFSHDPQIPHFCQFTVYLFSFRSNQFIYHKKCVSFVSRI